MGNQNCCNADKDERLQVDNQLAGNNPEGKNRNVLKGAGGFTDNSRLNNSSISFSKKENIIVNHNNAAPQNAQSVQSMFDLSPEAQASLAKYGSFEPKAASSTSNLCGPYKYIQDSFNLEWFYPAITNQPVNVNSMKKIDTTYYGQYNSSSLREGYGILVTSDWQHFSGMFKNDLPSGEGRIIFNNGDLLVGKFRGNSIDGVAELHRVQKDTVYTGQFLGNMPNGQGQLRSTVGDAGYTGEWKNGLKSGYGSEKWEDGTLYEGNFLEDQKHGNGKFTWPDRATYEGQFQYNSICGKGVHKWGDGRIFTGGWLDNKMHGKLFNFLIFFLTQSRRRSFYLERWN